MKSSFLVQRLMKPTEGWNPFSFGGGYANGGLSDQAVAVLSKVFSPDYMGSAEFEFGALPEAFQNLVKSSTKKAKIASMDIKVRGLTVWCIFNEEHHDRKDVDQRVVDLMNGNHKTKESLRCDQVFEDIQKAEVVGWFDLNNSILFGVDKDMKKGFENLLT